MKRVGVSIKAPVWSGLVLYAVAVLLSGCSGGGGGSDSIPPFNIENGVAAADLNGDERIDIVMASTFVANPPPHPGSLLSFLQRSDGSGTFMSSVSYPIGSDPWQVAIADVSGDGLPDVVVANTESSNISVLLNSTLQPGTFSPTRHYSCAPGPYSVAIGDLNGDGLPDIAVAIQRTNPGGVSLLFQDPASIGTFLPAVQLSTGFPSIAVAVADLDGDGRNDIVLTGSDSVSVLLQAATNSGSFLAGVAYSTGSRASFVTVTDIDGDQRLDIVVANSGSTTDGSNASVSVLLQDPFNAGIFLSASSYTVANGARALAIGDLNGDGAPDLAIISLVYSARQSSKVSLLFQEQSMRGVFRAGPVYTGGFSSNSIALGDFNSDGRLDILINDGPLILFQNPSLPGNFLTASRLPM